MSRVKMNLCHQLVAAMMRLEDRAEAGGSLSNVFQNYEDIGTPVVIEGINNMQAFTLSDDMEIRVAAINGLLTGMLMADYSLSYMGEEHIKAWLGTYSKLKGENVVDFQQFKIKKGR